MKRQVKPPQTFAEAYERCLFRTVIGCAGASVPEMLSRVGLMFAAIGGECEAFDQDRMQEAADCLQAGQTVLVLADRADLRDNAAAQFEALAALLNSPAVRV